VKYLTIIIPETERVTSSYKFFMNQRGGPIHQRQIVYTHKLRAFVQKLNGLVRHCPGQRDFSEKLQTKNSISTADPENSPSLLRARIFSIREGLEVRRTDGFARQIAASPLFNASCWGWRNILARDLLSS